MIWQACQGDEQITPIKGMVYRLVESQEQVATMGYVDSLEEQALLEEMIEAVKPSYPEQVDQHYHYLLTTPFRYPPLPHGSRFGTTSEPSLFYGGENERVALSEVAYYRFLFLSSIDGVGDDERISTQHTMFSAVYQTEKGIRLHAKPFNDYQDELTSKTDYAVTQQLGRDMRAAGVKVFEYTSSRDKEKGVCIGLFDTSGFKSRKPTSSTAYLCDTTLNSVTFKACETGEIMSFSVGD
jgi:hypothetical protein